MSDNDNSNAADKASAIDQMILASANARGEIPQLPRPSAHPGLRVKVEPGQATHVEYLDAESARMAEQLASIPEGEINDDGRDLEEELKQIAREAERFAREADACRYDPETGAKIFKHPDVEREKFAMLARQGWIDLEWQMAINAKIKAQRERKAAEKEAQDRATLEREQWLNEQAVRRADEMEIEKRALAIVQQRRAKSQ